MTKAERNQLIPLRTKSKIVWLAAQPDGVGQVHAAIAESLVRRGYATRVPIDLTVKPRIKMNTVRLTAIGFHFAETGEQKGA